ncbi:MAG: nucleotide exchange factor GrpE [Bacteroidota bacterium]|nr:nucleotide exchange factor GrpE [Bacteroidota bacterium]
MASTKSNKKEKTTSSKAKAARPSKAEKEKQKLKELENQIAETNEKYLRLYSEFENFRKRTAKEKLDLMGSAGKEIMINLLPVLDDFERAKNAMVNSEDIKALKEGVELVSDKFIKTLKNKGLESYHPIGEAFDSEMHEAVTQIPAPNEKEKGKIIDVVEKGYTLNGQVIRYAKVIIGA